MINIEMYKHLSVLFHDFFEEYENGNTQTLRKAFKLHFETLIEQIYSSVYLDKEFKNLDTTLLVINSEVRQIEPNIKKIIDLIKKSLSVKYPFSNQNYTDNTHEINSFICNHMIPIVISIIDWSNDPDERILTLKRSLVENNPIK